MKSIHLLPLGGASPELVGVLPGLLRQTFRTQVETHAFSLDPEPFFDPGRSQYDSTRILMHLKTHYPSLQQESGVCTLALVPFDLFIPILTYVFGEAEVGGTWRSSHTTVWHLNGTGFPPTMPCCLRGSPRRSSTSSATSIP